MGSFAATCAITRLAIMANDPVFYVRTRRPTDTYRFLNDIHRYLDLLDSSRIMQPVKPWERIAFLGSYDGYGGIREEGEPIEFEHGKQFFVHWYVLERILIHERWHQLVQDHPTWDDERKYVEALRLLLEFCMEARIQLMGHELVGGQELTTEELEAQEFIQDITRDMHGTLWEELAGDDEDEDSEDEEDEEYEGDDEEESDEDESEEDDEEVEDPIDVLLEDPF